MRAVAAIFGSKTRRWLPGVLISVVALAVVLQLATWQDIELAFTAVRPLNLAAAVALTLISLSLRAQAWRVLLDRKATFKQAFWIICEGYLLNNIFPLRAGELGRAVFMGRATGLGTMHTLSTIVIERAFDLAIAAGLLLGTLPLALAMDWARPLAITTIALVVLGLAALYLMARYNRQAQALAYHVGGRFSLVNRHLLPRFTALLRGLSVLTRPTQFLISLMLIALGWVSWVAIYYVMLLTIAPTAPFWWGIFVTAVLALGVALPSAPAALGVFEAAIVGALAVLGVSAGAVGFAFVMHLFQFVITAILGLTGLMLEHRSLSNLLREIQS